MKLTKKQIESLPALYSQENEPNPKAYIHFFNPIGRGDWYAMEGRQEGDDFLFFGYVRSPLGDDCDELGYFTLNQIKDTGIIELDKHFEPVVISEIKGE